MTTTADCYGNRF